MNQDTSDNNYAGVDDTVQVPESSPTTEKQESSPLKTYPSISKEENGIIKNLNDRFSYNSSVSASPFISSAEFVGTTSGSVDLQLKEMHKHYPDFSDTLIRAVFKSNSFSIPLTIDRLNELRQKKMAKSWALPSKKLGSMTSRLPSLNFGEMQNNGQSFGLENSSQPMGQRTILSSLAGSSKVTLERQKKSIFDRYSHVMQRGNIPKESAQLKIIASKPDFDVVKKRKLVRGDNVVVSRKTKKVKVTLSEEEEDEISEDTNSADESGGGEYERHVQEVDIDEKVLQFLNEAEASDIADLSESSIEKAQALIVMRPFKSLSKFSDMDFSLENSLEGLGKKAANRRRGQSKKDGAKILEKITQSMKGYNAIESLIKKCSSYGDLISTQMKKWGVGMDNTSELNFLDVNVDDRSASNEDERERDTQGANEDQIEVDRQISGDNDHDVQLNSNFEYSENEEDDELDEAYEDSEDEDFGQISHKGARINHNTLKADKKEVKFFKKKPKLLSSKVSLKDYQQTGINWLNLLYQNKMSCILADEMGLGKTCQVISFIAYLKGIGELGPHLIVVPSSTLENWLREFEKFCPRLKIEPYYGSQQERAELREILEENEGQYDVIVTTYNLASGNKYDVSFLKNRNFNVVVYDEGHMLKNSMSERFSKLMKIKANFRLLLTGTPLQNNLRELISLLEFIMPSLFVSKKGELAAIFKQRARTFDSNADYNPLLAQEAIDRAKTMMKPFILRRRKDQVLKHLPAKHSKIVYCEMTKAQQAIYQKEIDLVMEHKRMLKKGLLPQNADEHTKVTKSISKNLIMSLRKASIHPLLFRHIYTDSIINDMSYKILEEPEYAENGNRDYILEDLSYMSDLELHNLCCKFPKTLSKYQLKNKEWMKSGKVEKLVGLLREIVNKKEKVLIFSLFTQVLEILEMVLSTLNINFVRLDGSTQVNDRQALIDKFHEDKSIPVFILSTKAGGFGINLVCANNVIIFDQSFNPHDDKQAADRAHRVGQTKKVLVTTLISKSSIEEKILQLAKNKLALDSTISADSKNKDTELDYKLSDLLEGIIYKENS